MAMNERSKNPFPSKCPANQITHEPNNPLYLIVDDESCKFFWKSDVAREDGDAGVEVDAAHAGVGRVGRMEWTEKDGTSFSRWTVKNVIR